MGGPVFRAYEEWAKLAKQFSNKAKVFPMSLAEGQQTSLAGSLRRNPELLPNGHLGHKSV